MNSRYNNYLPSLHNSDQEVIDYDTRVRITDTTWAPYRYICQMFIQPTDGKKYAGTGFFISPRTILTTGHNIWDKKTDKILHVDKIILRPALNGDLRPPFGTFHPVKLIPSYPGYSAKDENTYLDYAIIHIDEDRKTGYFGQSQWTRDKYGSTILPTCTLPAPVNKLKVYVAGYPGDLSTEAKFQYQSSDLAVRLDGNGRMLHYKADTFGGMSGSPVWYYSANSKRIVIGIHTGPGDWSSGKYLSNKCVFLTDDVKRFVALNKK